MSTCAIKWCGKSSRTSSYQKDGITFHRFPRYPERKNEWIDRTGRGEEWFPRNTSVICSKHFTDDNFYIMKKRRRLMDTAVPSLYLPILISSSNTSGGVALSSIKINETAVAGTSYEKSPSSLISKDSKIQPVSENQSKVLETPKQKRRLLSSILSTPSACDTLVKKRLCRRVIELTNTLEKKNKKIKKLSDSNRRLKRQIVSLKTLVAELKKK